LISAGSLHQDIDEVGIHSPKPTPSRRPRRPDGRNGATISAQLLAKARADEATLLRELASRLVTQAEADAHLKQIGPNAIAREKRQSPLRRLLDNVKNPLLILLVALGVLSYLTGDLRALTGEALPVERKADHAPADVENPLELPNLCFLGSNVESGSATAMVIHTETVPTLARWRPAS